MAPVTHHQAIQLPDAGLLDCCWQAQEQIHVHHADGDFRLFAAVVSSKNGLTVVLMDAVHQRLVTILQHGIEVQTQFSQPSESVRQIPIQLLMAGLYLRHLDLQSWQMEADWRVELAADGVRKLFYRENLMVSAQPQADPHPSDLSSGWELQYHAASLCVQVRELSRESL